MSTQLAILLLTAVVNLILGLTILFKNPSQRINQYFGVVSIAAAVWTLSNGLVNEYAATPWGAIWARTAFAAASVIAISLFLFVSVFPSPKPIPSRKLSFFFVGTGMGTFLLSFTPLVARSTDSVDGLLQVAYGPLHPFFGTYFISCLSYSLFLLIRKLRVLKGIEGLQVRYVFLGVLLASLVGTTTNLIVPLVFRSSQLSPYGPLSTIPMQALIAHSIIRHRLMNVRLVIRHGTLFLLTIVTTSTLFVLMLWLASELFISPPQELALWINMAIVLVVALLFHPLKGWVQTELDRYFFRQPYDYQRAIREITRSMGTMLDLDALLDYVCEAIRKTVQPEYVAVYTKDVTVPLYKRLAARRSIEVGQIQCPEIVPGSSPLIILLLKTTRYVLLDELGRDGHDRETRVALEELRHLGGEFALPILEDGTLTGFFLVGPKLSGDPYFSEDIDLLTTLASQAAIAIRNAQLYRQVVLVNDYIENILATIQSGVIAVAADRTVTLFNSAAERITGYDAKNIKGSSVQNLPATIAATLEATLTDGQPRPQLEGILADKAGKLIPMVCSTSTLKDRSGAILGAVSVFSDLTRLKELEAENRRTEWLASVGALASGIAHEIKNPLVAIKTFAELLPERFIEEDFRGEFSTVVIREIERIDQLVARLRGLASPPGQPLTRLDIRTPIEETVALLRAQLEQARITVRSIYDRELPLINGDMAQLKQLFLNLFMNALEAMEPSGQLSVRLTANENPGGSALVVEVRDTGVGIPDELLEKIFDPFVTTKPGGSGLGLSICRQITDAHHAMIRIQKNKDIQGTTIVLEFPAAHDIPAATQIAHYVHNTSEE